MRQAMASPNTVFRASRPMLRQAGLHAQARQAFRAQRFTQHQQQWSGGGRRWQSTAEGAHPSWFKRMWESEVGLKTVHFWYV